jgi:hypothetical protein
MSDKRSRIEELRRRVQSMSTEERNAAVRRWLAIAAFSAFSVATERAQCSRRMRRRWLRLLNYRGVRMPLQLAVRARPWLVLRFTPQPTYSWRFLARLLHKGPIVGRMGRVH